MAKKIMFRCTDEVEMALDCLGGLEPIPVSMNYIISKAILEYTKSVTGMSFYKSNVSHTDTTQKFSPFTTQSQNSVNKTSNEVEETEEEVKARLIAKWSSKKPDVNMTLDDDQYD